MVNELVSRGVNHRSLGQHHHATPGRVQVDCHQCSPGSGKYRLGIKTDLSRANCWVCGKVDVRGALYAVLGHGSKDLIERVKALPIERDERPSGKLELPHHMELQPAHKKYLRMRGFDPDALGPWEIAGIAIHPRLAWRLLLPIHGKAGQIVSWTTRSIGIGEGGDKYVNAPPSQEAQPARHQLYGQHLAGHAVSVHEGPLDAVRVGPGGLATMGVVYTPNQLNRIADYPVRVVCFDSEPKAQERARRLCDALAPFAGQTLRVELDAKDPASAPEKEVRALRRLLRT